MINLLNHVMYYLKDVTSSVKHGFKKTQNLTGKYKKKIAKGTLNLFLAKNINF